MEIHQVSPDDASRVRAVLAVSNAVSEADSPWLPPHTEQSMVGAMRHGWDGEPAVRFLATDGDDAIGAAAYSTSTWDNTHLAWLEVSVHPDHRRRGLGSEILAELLTRASAEGRTSVGIDGWESDSTRAFAASHGFDLKAVEVMRRQVMADVEWPRVTSLHEAARVAAGDYELVRRVGRTPEEELPSLAVMTAAINDAPTDDLDIEDEVFTPTRIQDYESAQLGRGRELLRVLARHRDTGELAGQTVVVVEQERPELGEQHDTSVVAKHRGHRLGLLLKTEMLGWLRETQPRLVSLDTWNAESNDHMIAVNEQLGYRVVGRSLAFQRSL
ncbi:GNAT family N-acetyltransferase [Nocardioides sp.]|uniref:GNAT family N-acetyltransferase n=1 Tax=Nocardioides sp. TaxID=35761 RepID=UPI0027331148|nr:GNAT family N-acetyltransferase [Nocardioides sp.]MDP3892935.1 GNAT family N-acetyltransferase [Nocardioides sp.]